MEIRTILGYSSSRAKLVQYQCKQLNYIELHGFCLFIGEICRLVVALLQLENPREIWQHTGGSGDGGIDGLGSDEAGDVVAVMQAKYYASAAPQLGEVNADRPLRRYAAVFLPENPQEPADETCLLNLDWIVRAVCRHWQRLPFALTRRIGEGTG